MNKQHLQTTSCVASPVRARRRVVDDELAASSKTGVEVADGLCGYWREGAVAVEEEALRLRQL